MQCQAHLNIAEVPSVLCKDNAIRKEYQIYRSIPPLCNNV